MGRAWESDYGTVEDPGSFARLYEYSPYHNVRPDEVPRNTDHDRRS